MNIFLRELKANLKSLLIWCGVIILFAVVGFSKFSAFYGNPDMLAILDAMPKALLDGMNMTAFNLTTVTGFYGIMVGYYGLLLCIAAVMWGSSFISKEERDRTVELTLTLPVTRAKVITGKALAAMVDCAILTLVTWGISLAAAQQYAPDAEYTKFVSLAALAYFILQMVFLAVGVFLGCALKRFKLAGWMAIGVLLVTYFMSIIYGLNKDLTFLKYTSPFLYFDAKMMLNESRLELPYVLLSAGIVIVFMALAYVTYKKRDLYI